MNRWAWILVAAAACAPPPAERLRNPKRLKRPIEDPAVVHVDKPVLEPRPNINPSELTPDFHDELRWPLTPMNHPVMEPKFPIAQVFAQPGIGWLELCERGVQNRSGGADKELISYLRGWCKAVDGDTDAACSNLAPLIKSTTPRLEAAVRNDLANILSQGHADKAEHYIRVHSLRDVGMLDLLAANYVEVGTTSDALTINRNAIDSDDYATPATQCLRWTRQAVLEGEVLGAAFKQVEAFTKGPRPDETCVREYHKLVCWSRHECERYLQDNGIGSAELNVITSVEQWPYWSTAADWWRIVEVANEALKKSRVGNNALDQQQLADVAVRAFANAVALSAGCTDLLAREFAKSEALYRQNATPDVAKRLDELALKCGPAAPNAPAATPNAPAATPTAPTAPAPKP